MAREKVTAKCILLISIIGLGIAILYDMELVRSVVFLYALMAVLALLIILSLQMFRRIRRGSIYSAAGNDLVNKNINDAVKSILILSILAEIMIIHVIFNIIGASIVFPAVIMGVSIRLHYLMKKY